MTKYWLPLFDIGSPNTTVYYQQRRHCVDATDLMAWQRDSPAAAIVNSSTEKDLDALGGPATARNPTTQLRLIQLF